MSSLRAVLILAFVCGQEPKKPVDPDVVALREAIQNSHLDAVKTLLAKNPKIAGMKDQFGEMPLDSAASMGRVRIADLLIAAGAELNIESASLLGKIKEVAAMLKEKPWLAKAPNKPLFGAVRSGHLELVKLLLDQGANPNQDYGFSSSSKYTPLSSAVGHHFEIAKLLCERGARTDVSSGDKFDDKLFLYAVAFYDARYVKLMLEHGADPDAPNEHGLAPLHVSASDGDLKTAKLLLDFHANINATTEDGATPLFFAAAMDHPEYCNYLLSRGAKLDIYSACALGKIDAAMQMINANPKLVNAADQCLLRTPLSWAARSGNVRLMELLISHAAEVNVRAPRFSSGHSNVVSVPEVFDRERRSDNGTTPLHEAVSAGHLEVARLLISKSADVNAKDEDGYAPLYWACWKKHSALVKMLIATGANVGTRTSSGATPLHAAGNDKECIAMLLTARADPNIANDEGMTPLQLAAFYDHAETAEEFLKHGAKLDWYSACLLGKIDIVKKLLNEDPKRLEARKRTPDEEYSSLAFAARGGHVDVVQYLVSLGAEYDSRKLRSPSPMVVAAMNGRVDVVKWFLDKADAHPTDRSTALLQASWYAQPEVIRLLLQYRADPNVKDGYFAKTPLHIIGRNAYSWGDPRLWGHAGPDAKSIAEHGKREAETARVLIAGGADVGAKDQHGETPLHDAAERGLAEVAAVLIENGADVNATDFNDRTPLSNALHGRLMLVGERDWNGVAELLRKHGAKE